MSGNTPHEDHQDTHPRVPDHLNLFANASLNAASSIMTPQALLQTQNRALSSSSSEQSTTTTQASTTPLPPAVPNIAPQAPLPSSSSSSTITPALDYAAAWVAGLTVQLQHKNNTIDGLQDQLRALRTAFENQRQIGLSRTATELANFSRVALGEIERIALELQDTEDHLANTEEHLGASQRDKRNLQLFVRHLMVAFEDMQEERDRGLDREEDLREGLGERLREIMVDCRMGRSIEVYRALYELEKELKEE